MSSRCNPHFSTKVANESASDDDAVLVREEIDDLEEG